jgi:hypothetical protein
MNTSLPDPIRLLETVHTSTMSASLRSDGLMQLDVNPGVQATLSQIKEAIEAIGKAGGGKSYPLLVLAGKDASVDTESMEFMSKENADPYSIAEAYLVSSISQKLLGNFYLSFNKPFKPTRIFTSLPEAVKWLHMFKK